MIEKSIVIREGGKGQYLLNKSSTLLCLNILDDEMQNYTHKNWGDYQFIVHCPISVSRRVMESEIFYKNIVYPFHGY